MNVFKIRMGGLLALLAMVIMLGGACGSEAIPSTSPAPPPSPDPSSSQPTPSKPSGNQPPVISLTSVKTQVYPLDIVEVRCEASDADDDQLNYEWSTNGGSFSGTGSVVSWVAPEHLGTYDVAVTVKDGKGGITQTAIQISVKTNQDPVISSLVADPDTVLPGAKSTVTCIANDPDGDVVNYSWKASDGCITGVGDMVTWIAADREGEFAITVTVDDGKGGQNVSKVSVTVLIPEKTVSLNPVAAESGTILRSGDKDTSKTVAGDSDTNESYRAFWSFDIYGLKGKDIKDAKLTFTTKNVVGDPFCKAAIGLGGLHLYRVRYEPGQLPDFNIEQHFYPELTSVMLWE
ncbi:MAG: PKD domain-containing protein, partial [Chloroflexota bacterium]|nr:PKD domain-containing protein [Chloroflexota bacterium]